MCLTSDNNSDKLGITRAGDADWVSIAFASVIPSMFDSPLASVYKTGSELIAGSAFGRLTVPCHDHSPLHCGANVLGGVHSPCNRETVVCFPRRRFVGGVS